MNSTNHGRATLRDIMELQTGIFDRLLAIEKEISDLKARVYTNAAIIGVAATIAINVFIYLITKGIKL